MPFTAHPVRLSLSASLALAAALAGCAPQAVQQAGLRPEVPSAVSQAQGVLPAGTFMGLVAAFDGSSFRPVAGARVEVLGTRQVATTDSEGQYRITGLAPGTYTYVVTRPGYERSESQVVLSPVAGTPRANVALNPAPSYALKQAATIITLSGVVKDPRGAALGSVGVNKTFVRIAAASVTGGQTTTVVEANAQGFYSTQLTLPAGTAVNAASPGFVQVTATGTSPGGVALASTAAHARTVTGTTAVLDPRCDAYTAPGLFTFPNGTFVRLEDANPEALVEIERASGRADEFYIEVQDSNVAATRYAVLASSIQDVAGANPPRRRIAFRPPATLSGETFSCAYRPFGVGQFDFGNNFVARYTATGFNADVTMPAASQTLADWSKSASETLEVGVPGTLPRNVNEGRWVPGETARYTLVFRNANTNVSQDILLRGTVPGGLNGFNPRIAQVLLTTRRNGALVDDRRALALNTNFTINDQTGAFQVRGFNIPQAVGAVPGQARLEIDFVSQPNLPPATVYSLTGLAVEMPSASLALTALPGTAGTQNFDVGTVRGDLRVTPGDLLIAKVIRDGTSSDGIAEVQLTATPTGSTALGAFRITDVTGTNLNTEPAIASLAGTATIAAGTNAILAGESLQLLVDGNAIAPIGAGNAELPILVALLNFASPDIVATAIANRLRIDHRSLGFNRTLQLAAATTPALRARLGLDLTLQRGQDGLLGDNTATGTGISTPLTPTGWTFRNFLSTHTAPGGVGRVTTTFTVVPPAAALAAGEAASAPITIRYNIRRSGGAGAFRLGGGVGPQIINVNTLAPYTDATRDVPVTGVAAPDFGNIDLN